MPAQPIVQIKNNEIQEELLEYFSLKDNQSTNQHSTTEEFEQSIEEEIIESFSKSKNANLSFEELKNSVIQSRLKQDIVAYVLTLTFGSLATTGVYMGILNLLGFFNIHPILNLALFSSSLVAFYSSSFFISKLLNKNKFFNFNKEESLSKIFIQKFNSSDTSSILPAVKEDLTKKLEQCRIKETNPYVYNYIAENIHRLDGDFNKLKYTLESQHRLGKYSFTPFRVFLNTIEEIENNIKDTEDIKIINS